MDTFFQCDELMPGYLVILDLVNKLLKRADSP